MTTALPRAAAAALTAAMPAIAHRPRPAGLPPVPAARPRGVAPDVPVRPAADVVAEELTELLTAEAAAATAEGLLEDPAAPAALATYDGDDSKPWSHRARPESPVGRTAARLADDPGAADPIRRLEARLGRPVVDLATLTDAELHAVTHRLLAERHRRDTFWHGIPA